MDRRVFVRRGALSCNSRPKDILHPPPTALSSYPASLILHYPLRREIKGPAKNQGNRKTDSHKKNGNGSEPFRQSQRFVNHINDLHDQPRYHEIDSSDLEYLAAFQF